MFHWKPHRLETIPESLLGTASSKTTEKPYSEQKQMGGKCAQA